MWKQLAPIGLVMAVATSGCASIKGIEAEVARITFPGVATVSAGKAEIDWLALRGRITHMSIQSLRGPLQKASATCFEDLNGNGVLDTGETVKSSTSTRTSDGFTLTDLELGWSELYGRNRDRLMVEFKVVDSTGAAHIHIASL